MLCRAGLQSEGGVADACLHPERITMPRYVVADDEEHQSDSSEEDEEAEEQEEDVEADEDDDEEQQTVEEAPAAAHDRKKIKLSLKQKNKDVCHVSWRDFQHAHAWLAPRMWCNASIELA